MQLLYIAKRKVVHICPCEWSFVENINWSVRATKSQGENFWTKLDVKCPCKLARMPHFYYTLCEITKAKLISFKHTPVFVESMRVFHTTRIGSMWFGPPNPVLQSNQCTIYCV